jgi:ligand-binding sensor domain-containing protein/two-component sensor histidine kinase
MLAVTLLTTITVGAQQSIFKTYTVSDGLVNNSVRRIFQDSKGFLWIATWEGLSKYDGNRFTNFTETNGLSHNLVNDLIELPSGDMYVATNNGTVDLIRHDQIKQQKNFNKIIVNRFQLTKDGTLLVLTDSAGIVEVDGNTIKYLNKSNASSCYGLVSLNDSLMAAATDTLPVQIFDKQFHLWGEPNQRIYGAVSNCVFKDLQGRLWVGTTKGLKLVSIDYINHHLKVVDPPAPFNDRLLSQGYVTCIFQEKNGTFWIGTAQGVITISNKGYVKQFTENDGLPSRFISSIFRDREANFWIGTDLGLVKMIAPTAASIPQGEPRYASLIERISSKEILVATDRSFYRYNFQSGKIKDILQLSNNKNFTYVTNSSPALFLYGNELYRYNVATNQLGSSNKISSSINMAVTTSATTDGQIIFLPSVKAILIYANGRSFIDSTFKMRVNNILADKKGFVWLGTWDDGLYRAKYDPLNQKWTGITHFSHLPDNHIRTLFEDREGTMWVGTRYNGLVRIAESGAGTEMFHVNQQKGLSSNWIVDLTEDADGNIWVVNKFGIDKLIKTNDGFALFNYSRITNFFPNVNVIAHAEGNRFFCSSPQGLCEIRDYKLEQTSSQPVYLTKVILAGRGKTAFTFYDIPRKVKLAHSTNNAFFEFTSPSYLNEKEILYSYRLKGSNDTVWSRPSNLHSVQYASLAPGNYHFEVRMLGWNGTYGPVTSFIFTVNPPYWRTWWFYLMVALFVSFVLYRVYKYRIDQLLRVQKVRNTIATDLHDDIGSTLTNISILSELGTKNLEEPPVAKKYLQRITEESVATQQALDDIIWSVNTRNDNIQELQARMRRYAGELFEHSNTTCQFDFPNADDNKLNMEQRRDVYLVFKECMNNIHKHASAKKIHIAIGISSGILDMLIEDDGKGFDPEIRSDRNGLQNLKSRVEKWKGNIRIDTAAGKGTTIKVIMPVKASLLK